MAVNDKTCSICLDYFTKPKIIDCRHTFCELCLDGYVKNVVINNQFRCPLCRQTNIIPDGGVRDYKVNFHALKKKKPVPVPRRKVNASVNLPTKETVLVSRRESGAPVCLSTEENEKQVVNPLCPQHNEEMGYCKDCNRTLCYQCLSGHQGHAVYTIEDMLREFDIFLYPLDEQAKLINSIVDFLKKEARTVAQQYAEECGKVDQRIEQMCQIIKDEGQKLKLKMKDSNLEHKKVIEKMTKAAKKQKTQIRKIWNQIEEMAKTNQVCEAILSTEHEPKLIPDINQEDFTLPDYSCPRFQDGVTDVEELSKQIGQIHNMGDGRFHVDNNNYGHVPTPGYENAQNPIYMYLDGQILGNRQTPRYGLAPTPGYGSTLNPDYVFALNPGYAYAQNTGYAYAQNPGCAYAQIAGYQE
ncbi:tripartite motif-containing protein 2 [Patella vulgata]|uniref:tripartite motif-containing protein 2 n=1 Tax=Patella vulgata TaxID=6465 RepID=UPI0024A923C7|nr:tripartite motif-containing protein 2 [Patella vulgata]